MDKNYSYRGGTPWWSSVKNPLLKCRGHRIRSCRGTKILPAVEQLSPWAVRKDFLYYRRLQQLILSSQIINNFLSSKDKRE